MSGSGLPRLLLFATGGTIAGRANDVTSLNHYSAGVIAAEQLLQSVPQLQELAEIEVEQIANVDSADLTFDHWRRLVARIREALAVDPDLAGVVIWMWRLISCSSVSLRSGPWCGSCSNSMP